MKPLLFFLLAGPCFAGDSVAPSPVEILVPTVIETADLGPYVPGMALSIVGETWSDDTLRQFVFGGPEPSQVPLPSSAVLLLSALLVWRKLV